MTGPYVNACDLINCAKRSISEDGKYIDTKKFADLLKIAPSANEVVKKSADNYANQFDGIDGETLDGKVILSEGKTAEDYAKLFYTKSFGPISKDAPLCSDNQYSPPSKYPQYYGGPPNPYGYSPYDYPSPPDSYRYKDDIGNFPEFKNKESKGAVKNFGVMTALLSVYVTMMDEFDGIGGDPKDKKYDSLELSMFINSSAALADHEMYIRAVFNRLKDKLEKVDIETFAPVIMAALFLPKDKIRERPVA